jgi:hypothetical protein
MTAPKVSDKEFIELWNAHKSAAKVAKILQTVETAVYKRRRNLENRYKIKLESDNVRAQHYEHLHTAHLYKSRHQMGIENGTVLVFSDAHFWPGIRTTAYNGLLWAIKELKPKAIINNGDAFDGASISRHPRIGWDSTPSVIEELKACEMALGEIEDAAGRGTKLVWCLGNHDARFENRLAANAPEFQGVKGFSLKDHFPKWHACWAAWVTENVVVKHRYKGGIHATHNNTVGGGKSIVTGHLHSLKVTPYSDYNGTRYGVDTGTLADTTGPQFEDYLESNPVNWRSGFAVLTFHDGKMLWPEVVHSWSDGRIEFRGKVIDVSGL